MQSFSYGRPLDGHALTDLETQIIDATFRLRESFGTFAAAAQLLASVPTAPAELKTVADFITYLSQVEAANAEVFEEMQQELETYEELDNLITYK